MKHDDELSIYDKRINDYPHIDGISIKQIECTEKSTIEPMIAFCASKSCFLVGNSTAKYPPPSQFWWDLDILNTQLYKTYQSSDSVMIQPQQEGLYHIEFFTTPYALSDSNIAIWIFKNTSGSIISYSTYTFKKGDSFSISLSRYARLSQTDLIYLIVRQFDPNGNLRMWIGKENASEMPEARQYSSLCLCKI